VAILGRPANVSEWETPELDEALFRAIGRLAVVCAEFENTCYLIHWKYAKLDADIGHIVTGDMSTSRLTEAIVKLATKVDRNKRRVDDIRLIFSQYRESAETRNKCIHWLWSFTYRNIANRTPTALQRTRRKRELFNWRNQ
jgi:hypothetical protein